MSYCPSGIAHHRTCPVCDGTGRAEVYTVGIEDTVQCGTCMGYGTIIVPQWKLREEREAQATRDPDERRMDAQDMAQEMEDDRCDAN